MEYRPLEGFVFAVSPFNFTAIGGNLQRLAGADGEHGRLEAGVDRGARRPLPDAGLPGGGPARRRDQPRLRLGRRDRRRGAREPGARRDPLHRLDARLPVDVEDGRQQRSRATATTRGSSARPAARTSSSPTRRADVDEVATAIVRGSFEYQGQKCSASSRVYAPSNLWPELRERLAEQVASVKMGDVGDFSNFMGAVIDKGAFKTQKDAIDEARAGEGRRDRRRRRLRRQRGLLRRADRDRDRGSRSSGRCARSSSGRS